jgi:hypothetical protein
MGKSFLSSETFVPFELVVPEKIVPAQTSWQQEQGQIAECFSLDTTPPRLLPPNFSLATESS